MPSPEPQNAPNPDNSLTRADTFGIRPDLYQQLKQVMVGKQAVDRYLEQAADALSKSEQALSRISEINYNVQDALHNSRQAINVARAADLASEEGKKVAISANTTAIAANKTAIEALNQVTDALATSDDAQNTAIQALGKAVSSTNLTLQTIPRFLHISSGRTNVFTSGGDGGVAGADDYGELTFTKTITLPRTGAYFRAWSGWTGNIIMISVGSEGNTDVLVQRIDANTRSLTSEHGALLGQYKSSTVIIFPDPK